MRLACALVLAGLLCSGCASLAPPSSESTLVDSLRAENAALQDRNERLRDSLAFADDVQSGQYHRTVRTLHDQLTRLSYELAQRRDGGQTVSVLQTSELFEPASARLTEGGMQRLGAVATQLRTTYPARALRVEGHTDDVPVGPGLAERYPSNWELSGARATTVVRTLVEMTGLAANQFTAVAYGATQPIATNNTERGRRRNRRVRIAVLPVPHDVTRPFEISW